MPFYFWNMGCLFSHCGMGPFTQHPFNSETKNKTKLKTYALQAKNLGTVLNAMITLDEKSREEGKKGRDPNMAKSGAWNLGFWQCALSHWQAEQARAQGVPFDTSFFLSPNQSPPLSPFHFTSLNVFQILPLLLSPSYIVSSDLL